MDKATGNPVFAPEALRQASRTITLADGRRLGLAEFGDPGGPPVLYFHGWPSSRFEPAVLNIRGVRIISVDRPGYGLSDPVTGPSTRRLADWPRDIGALADALGLRRFAVFGMSGGAPYAASVAAAMPARVAALALISGVGPPDAPGMQGGRMSLLLGFGTSPIRRKIVFTMARQLLLSERAEETILSVRKRLRSGGARDQEAFTDDFALRLLACWREGLGRSIEGAASDARIYGEPWPFSPADIRVPTIIWHGEMDAIVPASIARHYARLIPAARTTIVPAEGHVSLIVNHHQTILSELLAHA